MRHNTIYLLLIFLFFSCDKKENSLISFYYWKTNYELSATEQEAIRDNNIQKIYIRYFDIDLNPKTKTPYPRSPIHFIQKPTVKNVVPVVYIKNSVMLQTDLDVEDLVQKTVRFMETINTINGINCREVQIDCDWSLNSKENYLVFIERFKHISKKKISATIRLHQVKYFEKTKVPNVDSGVLMYYNMGTISMKSGNSIYDRSIAKRYISSLNKYPLALNVALPIYSWGIHSRDNNILGLRSKLTFEDLQKDENFLAINTTTFKVIQSNYRKGVFYKKGDFVKIEAVTAADLKEMAEDLKENLAQKPKEIIFYDLDQDNLKNYEKNIFKQISSCF
ncbi:hypothetical protein B6A10_01455 [Flavobacterium sp. L1I52]|uniref:Lipoprotein n=1 Tax=Flavobacterium pokkalii TaxID=1940408 RepID=A0ABR7ULT5_9FLAO|nr:hypothetical protein [Flavobacterium pokkalii]MBD0723840.1 hypothetical protein [Flavobacterium pokkalii]